MEPIAIYLLILLTVAVIASLPRLIVNPTRSSDQCEFPLEPMEQPAQDAPARPVLAEVD